jgi:adenylate cyclase
MIIAIFVFTCVLTLKHAGLLQFLEFQVYDFFIRQQPKAQSSEPIRLVEMTEADIHSPSLDYPVYDNKLAELLRKIEVDQPAVIGVDLWRDIPVPKSGIYVQELNQVLESFSNIVAIFTLDGIAPPPILKSDPERVAFNDNFPPDVGVDKTIPKVRRSLLTGKTASGETFDSLPFRLAQIYLARKGIEPEADPADPNSFRLGKSQLRKFRPNDGAYIRADAHGWQMLLDFKCPDDFHPYSFVEVLSGQVPPGTFHDKIVLVGMNSASVFDERVTPTRRDHRGIEVQSLTINQLLRQALDGEKPLRSWSDWLEDGWILLWSLAGGAVGYWVHTPWRFGATSALCLLLLSAFAWLSFLAGRWIPVVAPAAAYAPAAALVISYVSQREKKQRAQLMKLFSKQVSPDIAQAIWEQREEFLSGQRPRSRKLTATVLFTDLEGFTATSEKMEPALLMDWLNEYMEAMAGEIMAHQGVIEKYIGDAIMAVFGVPLPRTSQEQITRDARNAVRCALAMRAKLDELNVQWTERGLPSCGMRVGIHTGALVAGSLGSADRQEYTVLGDTVNTASRLESFSKEAAGPGASAESSRCRILISEATYALLGEEFQASRVGMMSLKNKKEPVNIYRITKIK